MNTAIAVDSRMVRISADRACTQRKRNMRLNQPTNQPNSIGVRFRLRIHGNDINLTIADAYSTEKVKSTTANTS